jgi:hypothetical protein
MELDLTEIAGALFVILCILVGLVTPQSSQLITILAVTVSAVTSYLVSRRSGARWAYERQAKKEHSMILTKELETWANKFGDYTRIGLSYSDYGEEGESGVRKSGARFVVLPARDPALRYLRH